tara:strand:+ start:384 stop:710 length:327 start_codon:yes stop_codon:yes gene_type:complete
MAGLYDNIHAKKARIASGSKEKMRKPGAKGAPTSANFKAAAKTAKQYSEGGMNMKKDMHKMPDGSMMKNSDHKAGYKHGGMGKKKMAYNMGGMAKCGASNPGTQKGSK